MGLTRYYTATPPPPPPQKKHLDGCEWSQNNTNKKEKK